MKFCRRKTTQKLKQILIGFFIFFFFSYSFAPAFAATPNYNPLVTTNNSSAPSATSSSVPEGRVTVPVGNGLETGSVLCGITDIPGCFSDLADLIWNKIIKNIGNLVMKVIIWLFKLVASIFGFAIDAYISDCKNIFGDQLSDLIGPTTTNSPPDNPNFNAFTMLDFGVSGVYSQIPKVNSVNAFAEQFNHNVLGIRTASAQGAGTKDIGSTIEGYWSAIEKVALVFMAVALVAIGFMVMLRRRLDPRTVVTATNTIPTFAVALILIVFSFAISGLFVDFIHISVGLVRSYFGGFLSSSFVTKDAGGELVWFPFFTAFSFSSAFNWSAIICSKLGFLGFISAGPLGLFAMLSVVFIWEFIMRLTLFIVGIYLFWILLKTYAYMIVFTIFSPLFFLLGAVPGFHGVLASWFKRMIANALVFPVILFFIYLGSQLVVSAHPIGGGNIIGAPPPIDSNILNISYLIGLGILFFATKVPKFIEKTLKIEDFDIRGGLGPGVLAAPITAPLGAAQSVGSFGRAMSGIGTLADKSRQYGGAASKALFRGGYERGIPTYNPASGNYETEAAVPKTGFGARFSQAASSFLPGFMRASGTRPGQRVVVTPEQRQARMIQYMDTERKFGHDFMQSPNRPALEREIGHVTHEDFNALQNELNTRIVKSTPPSPGAGHDAAEKKATDEAREGRD